MAAASLYDANLLRANLSGADLWDANRRDADLTDSKTGQLPGTALMTLLQQAGWPRSRFGTKRHQEFPFFQDKRKYDSNKIRE